MQNIIYEVENDRFHIKDRHKYILQGLWPTDSRVEAYLDDTLLKTHIEAQIDIGVMNRYQDKYIEEASRVTIVVTLPEGLGRYHKLKVYYNKGRKKILWFTASVKKLIQKQNNLNLFIEEERYEKESDLVQIRGWVASAIPVELSVYDRKKHRIDAEILWSNRLDVDAMFFEGAINEKSGFFIKADRLTGKVIHLVLSAGETKTIRTVNFGTAEKIREKFIDYTNKSIKILRIYGAQAFAEKLKQKITNYRRRPITYQRWLPKHLPTEKELQAQRTEKFEYNPKFSIVVPLYKTPKLYLNQMIESVQAQTYSNWELCLSDGSGAGSPISDELIKIAQTDKRIKILFHDSQLRISANTNLAIESAVGDYIVFMDHDDVLCKNALYECVKILNQKPDIEILYSDEDKMTMDGHKFFQPHFKPDFNPDLLRSVNYICHLFVVKGGLQKKVGFLREEYDGAQDYDFILRCIENTEKISHIPKILYHWRSHENSTAENPESKSYAFEAGERAIQSHYERVGIRATVSSGEYPGLYRSRYHIDGQPLISIIIPNKDHILDLKRCMDSIYQKSTYKNYEIIIVENNSIESETFEFYKEIASTYFNVHVVYWKGIFNYSEINNFGASYAKGEYLLLLNNDTEVINSEWLEEMLGYCMRSDVGIVGARLYYPDNTIQHAGVVIGFGGIAGHCFIQQPRSSTGYCHRIICAQDYSAVTAACMMVRKSVFDQVGGLSSELQVAFNDIDFCLKVRKAGYLVVYNPYAELYHYESKSRGLEDTPEKVERFNREIKLIERKWPLIFQEGDPYYNPNLSLETQDFSLRRLD